MKRAVKPRTVKKSPAKKEKLFACLFASIKWYDMGQFDDSVLGETEIQSVKKKSSKKSRTFISVSGNPQETLEKLREGSIPLPGTKKEQAAPAPERAKIAANMEIACVVGPIENRKRALAFRQLWEERSRGLVSRSATGSVLARKYNYRCSINWNAFYRLARNHVRIEEMRGDDGHVTELLITVVH